MIYGIGVDIVKVERIKEAVERWGERFLRRVFTPGEIAYCYKKKNPFLSLSARFAAKEAFIKAAGSSKGISLADIEVRNSEGGVPFISVENKLKEFLAANSLSRTHLSLSHEKDYAVALVVIEK